MAEFIARDPNAKVHSYIIQGYLNALGAEGAKIADKYGFKDIDPTRWYSLKDMFDMLQEINQLGTMNAVFDLVKIGMKAADIGITTLQLKPDITHLFLTLDDTLQKSHEGNVGHYEVEQLASGHIQLACYTDYPCDLLYGGWYAAARITHPPDTQFTVIHREGACKKHGDDHCIYDIKWWEESEENEEA